MNKPHPIAGAIGAFDAIASSVCGIGATVFTAVKTPPHFWIPCWCALILLFAFAMFYGANSHWPSTLFGFAEMAYLGGVFIYLHAGGMRGDSFGLAICGLGFVHAILYIVTIKRCSKFDDSFE